MSFWVLMQVLVNIILVAACGLLWVRLHRPTKDDPRLSKGLQLLQSKIAVLEDLSDRTEHQVSQLTAILETKCREIQEKIIAADKQIAMIDQSAQKSLEVAKIFQDCIPHSEIVERQNTIRYVKAARLAHRGASLEEISREVDMSRAEIELIAKVNRERLQFSEADLPEWAREESQTSESKISHHVLGSELKFSLPREKFEMNHAQPSEANQSASGPLSIKKSPPEQGGQKSNQRFMEFDLSEKSNQNPVVSPASPQLDHQPSAKATAQFPTGTKEPMRAQTSSGKDVQIRPVTFPRIESPKS